MPGEIEIADVKDMYLY